MGTVAPVLPHTASDDRKQVADPAEVTSGTVKQGITAPPYMRPFLKPSRSDPTLLSSYGDDSLMLMRPPYHHIQAMYTAGAQASKALIAKGRRSTTYFNRRGDLRHIKSLRYWGLEDVLQKKYHMHPLDAKDLSSLLLPMLRLAPEERRTAQDLLSHPWLRGQPGPEAADAVARVGPQPLPSSHPPDQDAVRK